MKHAVTRLEEERRALLAQLEDCRAAVEAPGADIVEAAKMLAQTECELRDVEDALKLLQRPLF